MSKKTLEELEQIKENKENEESRIALSLSLNICPECGSQLHLKCGFWTNKLICICGYKKTTCNSDGGWE